MINKLNLLFYTFILVQIHCIAQPSWPYQGFKMIKEAHPHTVYLDTLNLDTLFVNYGGFQKIWKSNENVILSQGLLTGGLGSRCGCDARPDGFWIMRYRNGTLKETGEFECGKKLGTWMYYYENGNVKKVESYQAPYLSFLTGHAMGWDTFENKATLLSGLYTEYHENGNLKVQGKYEIVEVFRTTDTLVTLDPSTYEIKHIVKTGSFWIPQSVKVGQWSYFDDNGKFIKSKKNAPDIEPSKYRFIWDRYHDLFLKGKK